MVLSAAHPPVGRIVLVHGAAHGAWCWARLTPELEELGYRVEAPDLPGLGEDLTPPAEVSFDSYVNRVAEILHGSPEPALLLGHSLGGTTISQAAEQVPEQVAKLVYLAAFLPRDGESVADAASANAASWVAARFGALAIRRGVGEDAHEFDPALVPEVFYNRCDPDVARWAAGRLRPQANAPVSARVHLSESRWGAIPKVYVKCTRDRALPPEVQQWFCDRVPSIRQRAMDSDHSPFLSNAPGLAALLHEEAQTPGGGAPG